MYSKLKVVDRIAIIRGNIIFHLRYVPRYSLDIRSRQLILKAAARRINEWTGAYERYATCAMLPPCETQNN